jgi:ABC-2 type transport system permease protein
MNDTTNEPTELGGPSETMTEQPTMIRILCGFGGLFLLTLGLATAYFAPMGRGLFSEGWGYLFTAVGCALLVFHAIRDADTEVRRVYGGLGALMLVLAVGLSIAPIKLAGMDEGVPGTLLVPWGALAGLLAALFLVNFARHETDAKLSSWVRMILATTGGLLAVLSVAMGLINPDTLPGSGSVLGLLALVYLICFVTVTDLSTGWPRYVPLGLGVLGGLAIVYAIGKAIFPIVLFEGPTALMSVGNTSGKFPIIGRVLVIVLSLSLLLALLWKSAPRWLRYSLAGTGVVFAALFTIGSFTTVGVVPPPAYFVPNGLILLFLGLAFTLTAIIVASDHPLAVLTRREVLGLAYSPIAYIVLFGAAFVGFVCHWFFYVDLVMGPTVPEPVLEGHYGLRLLGGVIAMFAVPVITMRCFSEEKKSGTLEMLFTAPVNEWPVVISKFLPAWIFFGLLYVPMMIYLLAMVVVGGSSFDQRPLLSYLLVLMVCGASFTSIGLFFSSLTRNQIAAAVMTFSAMMFMFIVGIISPVISQSIKGLSPSAASGLSVMMDRIGFYQLWGKALAGQLELAPVVFHASVAVFFLFATTKVLEARKWN